MKYLQCTIVPVLVFAGYMSLMGCGARQPWEEKGISEAFYMVTKDLSQRYLTLDADSAQYDQALEAVERYLFGEMTQKEAQTVLDTTIEAFGTALAAEEIFTPEEDFVQYLTDAGLSPVEYASFVNSRSSALQSQQEQLTVLQFYLEYAEMDPICRQDLEFFLIINQEDQDSQRGYYYYGCLNYWFPNADAAELAHLQEVLIDHITSLRPREAQEPVWLDDSAQIEEKTMGYLDEIEKNLNRVAQHLGAAQEEMYELEQEVAQ